MGPMVLSILGAVMTAVGGFATAVAPARYSKVVAAIVLVGTGFSFVSSQWSDRLRDGKDKQAAALQEENVRITTELDKYTRGSGSFCYFGPTVSSPKQAAILTLMNEGTYPMYDVRIRIRPDPSLRLPVTNGMATFDHLEETMRLDEFIDVGTLNPSNAAGFSYPTDGVMRRLELGSSATTRAFNIFFSSRNDRIVQFLRFAQIEGKQWRVAYRVVRQVGGQIGPVLKEFAQPDYPRNSAGEIDWGN